MNGLMRLITLLFCFLFYNIAIANPIIIKDDCSQTLYSLSQKSPSNQTLVLIFQDSDCYNNPNRPDNGNLFNQLLPNADQLLIQRYTIDDNLAPNLKKQRPGCPIGYDANVELININRLVHNLHQKKNYKNIIVIGGYQGATTAYQLAAENNLLPLKAVITFNSGKRKLVDEIEQAIAIIDQFDPPTEPFSQIAVLNPAENKPWLKSIHYHEQKQLLTNIDIPILVIQATRDINIDSESVEQMIQRLTDKGKQNISYTAYADLDNSFVDAQGNYQDQLVLNDISQWINQVITDNH